MLTAIIVRALKVVNAHLIFCVKFPAKSLTNSARQLYNFKTSSYFGYICQQDKFQRWIHREPGANPGRSRHCNCEQAARCHWGM